MEGNGSGQKETGQECGDQDQSPAAAAMRTLSAEDAVLEPTVLESMRTCVRAKRWAPADLIGALSSNYRGYARARRQHEAHHIARAQYPPSTAPQVPTDGKSASRLARLAG